MRKVCPGRWLIAVPWAGARSRASLTYLVPAAHKAPASRPPFPRAWGAAVRARASRRRSAPVRAVPGRARGARPPPPPPRPPRARLLWLLPAPNERCLRLRRPGSGFGAGTGGRGEKAGGRGGERGGAANGVPCLAPAAPPAPPCRPGAHAALRSAACAHVCPASAGPWAAARDGAAVNVSPLGGLVCAQLGPGEHGVKGRNSASRKASCSCAPTSAQRLPI